MRLWLLICNVGRAREGGLLSLEPEARVTYPGKEGTHKPISRGQVQQGGEGGTEGTAAVILLLGTSRRGEATMQAGACHADAIAQVAAVPSSECQVLHDANVRAGTWDTHPV